MRFHEAAYTHQFLTLAWVFSSLLKTFFLTRRLDQIPYVSYPRPPEPKRSLFKKLGDLLRALVLRALGSQKVTKWAVSTITKLSPPLGAFLWASPLLVKWAPKHFPAWAASWVASLERQIRDPSSGFLAKAGAVLWAGSLLAFPKLRYFYIAAGSATFWGVGFAAIPGALLYALSRVPAFQASGLLSLILTLPPAFLAAIPTLELFGCRKMIGYGLYTALAGAFSIWASVNSPGNFVATISPVAWFVFLPLAITAGEAAWAGAGKGAMVHEGFFELYSKPPSEAGPKGEDKKPPRIAPRVSSAFCWDSALKDTGK